MEDNLTTQLSEVEKAEFEILEGVIRRERGSFIALGNALLTIRDQRLYREGFKTFKEYCAAQWGISKTQANRMIGGVRVVENLTPRGALCTPCEIQPTNEYQIRPLAILEPAQQCEVWEEAVRSADGKTITYKQVKTLVNELVGPKPPKPPKEPEEYTDAVYFADIALSQLSRIRDEDPKRDEAIKMVSDWVEKEKNKKIGRNKK